MKQGCLVSLSSVLLAMALATGRAVELVMGGAGWSIGIMRIMAEKNSETHPEVNIVILSSVGSGGGIRAVVAGKFDLSFAFRLPKPKNQAKGLSGVPLLRTPFVLAVSDQVGANSICRPTNY